MNVLHTKHSPFKLPDLGAEHYALRALDLVSEPFCGGKKADGPIQVVDLFCGAGGLSAGFEAFGRILPSFKILGGVDRDPWATKTYSRNLPAIALERDIGEIARSPARIEQMAADLGVKAGQPLVLMGGPPCQGFSAHRKKNAVVNDTRNDLVAAFTTVATALRPEYIVFENVPEVMSEKHWDYFDGMCKRLKKAGYNVAAAVHNLAGFGVPQERFRTVLVGCKLHPRLPKPLFARNEYRTVRQAIGHLPPIRPGRADPFDPMHVCSNHRKETVETIRQVPRDGGRRPPGVGPRCLQEVDGFRDVYGRLFWDRPANTITAYARNPASGRYTHPHQHRGLSVREAALLQSFPPDYVFDGPFDHRFLQIGNAVPPRFATVLAAHIFFEMCANDANSLASDHAVLAPHCNSFSSGLAGRKKA